MEPLSQLITSVVLIINSSWKD